MSDDLKQVRTFGKKKNATAVALCQAGQGIIRGSGSMNQIMAVRMAIAKAVIAFAQKYEDEQSKRELKDLLLQYDKMLLTSDSRRCEPKKFGGKGARARFQKSYR